MNQHIVIITGSAPLGPSIVDWIPPDAVVMAVDGGLDHALAAGLSPTHLIGDLDSVTEEALAWAARHADISRHPADKDQTDTELALALAATFDPERITVIGGGDRLDHSMAAVGALGALTLTSVPVLDCWWGDQHIRVVHGPGSATLRLRRNSTLSLLALHGPCTNVNLQGARWELDHRDLDPVVGVGISNVVVGVGDHDDDHAHDDAGDDAVEVTVALSRGVLTIFDEPVSEPADQPGDEQMEVTS